MSKFEVSFRPFILLKHQKTSCPTINKMTTTITTTSIITTITTATTTTTTTTNTSTTTTHERYQNTKYYSKQNWLLLVLHLDYFLNFI